MRKPTPSLPCSAFGSHLTQQSYHQPYPEQLSLNRETCVDEGLPPASAPRSATGCEPHPLCYSRMDFSAMRPVNTVIVKPPATIASLAPF